MLENGKVVRATSGRDAGGYYIVVGSKNDRILIADGKRRKLETPKRKNCRHLLVTDYELDMESITGNEKLRKMLNMYNQAKQANESH